MGLLQYDRKAIVTVNTIQITNLNLKFVVKRNIKSQPSTCDLSIYNLSAAHRKQLQSLKTVPVQIDAGYTSGTSTIFLGNLRTGFSEKQGTDWITQLNSGDGETAIQQTRIQKSFRKGTDIATILNALADALGVNKGNISTAISQIQAAGHDGLFSGGTVLSGSAAREMNRIMASVGFTWSIQNETLQILPLNKALDAAAILVSQNTGMIGGPTVDKDGTVTVKTLMRPDIYPGRKMVIESAALHGQFTMQECTYTGELYGNDWYIENKGKPY